MISVLTNSIPSQYLFPLAIGGSLNKRLIFPLASRVADWVTGISPDEAVVQHQLFDTHFTKPLESVVNPLENKAFELVGGEFLSSLASVIPVDKKVESSKEPELKKYGEQMVSKNETINSSKEITPQGMSNEEASKK